MKRRKRTVETKRGESMRKKFDEKEKTSKRKGNTMGDKRMQRTSISPALR